MAPKSSTAKDPDVHAVERLQVPYSTNAPAFGSDVVAETLSALDIPYIALNPGASYRGLHDSIVNFLGNEQPQMILCLHEEAAVAIAHGYASVLALTRIAGVAGNRPRPFETEGDDAWAAIAWIAQQPWSDGRVAMQGFGYGGFAAWAAAKRQPPALKAIATICETFEEFPPGHFLTRRDGKPVRYYERDWFAVDGVPDRTVEPSELKEALSDAVHAHLMTDVPYGVLLSGGLDSSVIGAVAAGYASKRVESGDHDAAWWPGTRTKALRMS